MTAAIAIGMTLGLASITAQDAPNGFAPAEISIGEPIALPFTEPSSPAAGGEASNSALGPAPAPLQPAAASGGPPGSGWLGLAVAESNVPGRWRIDAVTPEGPAAKAGIIPGDELRALNGISIVNGDELAEALATIAAGQTVRMAVARGETLGDVILVAEPRPATPRQQNLAQQNLAPQNIPQQALPQAGVPVVPERPWQSAASSPQVAAVLPPPAAPPPPSVFPGFLDAAPGPLPADAGAAPAVAPRGRTALGVRTVPIDSQTQARFSLPEPTGAYVIGVVQDLPASKAGVPPGSVIVALDDRPVRSPVDLTNLVTSSPVDRPVTVQFVLPGGESKRAAVVLQPLSVPLERALTGEPVATSAPTLEPGPVPQRVDRPTRRESVIDDEIRDLRQRIEQLERRLAPGS